jgi:signal transduction histidine kinase
MIKKIIKRFKYSIAFKISAAYFFLYLTVILIVAVTTSAGYLIYEIDRYKGEVMDENLSSISRTYPEIDTASLNDTKDIKYINIYDENLNLVYNEGANSGGRYSRNIIVTLNKLFFFKEYVHSSMFVTGSTDYYINIGYSVFNMIDNSIRIIFLVLISGVVGLLIIMPITSHTSYNLLGPIKNMTEITRTITVNNINKRLDITGTQDELKELSQTFNEMMDRIEEGYKSQQQFVSDASHELRTPIAVIKGYVNMLDRWGKNDKAVLDESISAIKNETESMQDLIEKLLFIARSDKQTLTFTKEDFRICEVLAEIEKESKMIDAKHTFEFKFYNDVNMYADKKRIKQAIRVFIENAIKFTPQGGKITIVSYTEEDYYIILVKDTGIGIEKKDLNKIFDRLYRAEQSRSKDIGGHGLGLSIAKIIILGHKGKIKVRSTVGKGSEFFIMLPYLGKVS